MQIEPRDAHMLAGPGEVFALIDGAALGGAADDALESGWRRMGLRPEAVRAGEAAALTGAEGPVFRLSFGTLTVLTARAARAMLALADPDDVATSSLGTSLPVDWRDRGEIWIVRPEIGQGAGARIGPLRLRAFCRLMVLLIDLSGARHIFWSSARLWTDARQFRGAIAEMQTSRMPPVLHLVAFRHRDGEAGPMIATRGLALFGGQELEARIPAGWDMAAMVKRLARLALDLMINGPVTRAQEMPGLHGGEWVALTLKAGANGRPATVLVEFSHDR